MAIPNKVQELLDSLSDSVRAAVLKSVENIKDRIVMANLVRAIESGDVAAVVRALNLSDEFFDPVADSIRHAYLTAGQATMIEFTSKLSRVDKLGVIFGGRAPRAEQWIRDTSSRVVADLVNASVEAVRASVIEGLADGQGAKAIARRLIGPLKGGRRSGGVIGLNDLLRKYADTARKELQGDNMRNYLSRELRDKRFDVHVLRSLTTGKPLSAEKIEQMVGRYSDRLLEYRAMAISRTTATPAYNAARHEAANQLVDVGRIREDDIVRKWRSAGDDGHTRDTHLEMDGQKVTGLKDPFVSPSTAQMMHPGDTSLGAPAEEIINCRCYEEISIDYIAARARIERAG